MTDPRPISFGIVTDCQFADAEPNPPNHFRDAPQKLRAALRNFNAHELAFIVNLGDTIDHDFDSFDTILPEFKSARTPVYHLLGNHDFAVTPEEKPHVPDLLGIPSPPFYRTFSTPGWRFLCLDGNQLSLAAHPSDSSAFEHSKEYLKRLLESGAKNARPYNGGAGNAQLGWLDSQLSEADSAGERAIVFNHFPVYPETAHNLWDASEVVEILTKHHSAIAHINGHLHKGGYAEFGGVHYLTVRALLETEDKPTSAIATLGADDLRIRGFGNQGGFKLPYR